MKRAAAAVQPVIKRARFEWAPLAIDRDSFDAVTLRVSWADLHAWSCACKATHSSVTRQRVALCSQHDVAIIMTYGNMTRTLHWLPNLWHTRNTVFSVTNNGVLITIDVCYDSATNKPVSWRYCANGALEAVGTFGSPYVYSEVTDSSTNVIEYQVIGGVIRPLSLTCVTYGDVAPGCSATVDINDAKVSIFVREPASAANLSDWYARYVSRMVNACRTGSQITSGLRAVFSREICDHILHVIGVDE